MVSSRIAWATIIVIIAGLTIALSLKIYAGVALPWVLNQAEAHTIPIARNKIITYN